MLNALLSSLLGGCAPCDNSCYNPYQCNQPCYQPYMQQCNPCYNQWDQYQQPYGCNNNYNPFMNNCCGYYQPCQCPQQVCYQGPAYYPQQCNCCCDNDKDHKKDKKKKKKHKKDKNKCQCNCCNNQECCYY